MPYEHLESSRLEDTFSQDYVEVLRATARMLGCILPDIDAHDVPPITAIRLCNIALSITARSFMHWAAYPQPFTDAIIDYLRKYQSPELADIAGTQISSLRATAYFDPRTISHYHFTGTITALFDIITSGSITTVSVVVSKYAARVGNAA